MKTRKVRFATIAGSVALVGSLLAGCASGDAVESPGETTSAATGAQAAELPAPILVLGSSDPAELALTASQTFFEQAPVVVVADATDPDAQATAAEAAVALTAPVLLTGGAISDDGIGSELERLGAVAAVHVGDAAASVPVAVRHFPDVHLATSSLREQPAGINDDDLRTVLGALPDLPEPEVLHEVLVLVDGAPGQGPAVATARAAGAVPLEVPDGELSASSEAVQAVAAAKALAVVGIGAGFGSADDLAWRVRAAETGAELPGGGQEVLPGKRYVTLHRSAVTPYLTELTEEEITGRVELARETAAPFEDVESPDGATIVPTLELAVTVASGAPGVDGNYSTELDVETVRPLVEAAHDAGVYVLLALQPGGSTFLEQVEQYDDLLRLPAVGLALDVEHRRAGNGSVQSGTVPVTEVDDVLEHVAGLVREADLPQKLVVVHQSSAGSVLDRQDLGAGASQTAVVLHSDVYGALWLKESAYEELRADAPDGVGWGWTQHRGTGVAPGPEEALVLEPAPDYISFE
ncbi:hypothetical protein [Oerskovia flava]|uniref:hypothetical protein n=1 Tax=Oerskovia flava TaxID=2986422 RepID=UPI0022408800|nr:hypothetical protein [Oerskovia sp. JB1-3-2]